MPNNGNNNIEMILRRLGNKKKLAEKILPYFPPHKIYIEPFFGAGGMFFQKPKAKYNIVNDLDSDVFSLFQVVMDRKEELKEALYIMPTHSGLFNHWKKHTETDPIKKALRFLLLSNFSYLGKADTFFLGSNNSQDILLNSIDQCHELLYGVNFGNFDFRKFLTSIYHYEKDLPFTFIYNDPPYIGTTSNYSNSFTEKDSLDLFNSLEESGCKWAMSEFNNPFILDQAKERGLNIHVIGERKNLKNRQTEILITNYQNSQYDLFNDQ